MSDGTVACEECGATGETLYICGDRLNALCEQCSREHTQPGVTRDRRLPRMSAAEVQYVSDALGVPLNDVITWELARVSQAHSRGIAARNAVSRVTSAMAEVGWAGRNPEHAHERWISSVGAQARIGHARALLADEIDRLRKRVTQMADGMRRVAGQAAGVASMAAGIAGDPPPAEVGNG